LAGVGNDDVLKWEEEVVLVVMVVEEEELEEGQVAGVEALDAGHLGSVSSPSFT
jgi:hypothetical protein